MTPHTEYPKNLAGVYFVIRNIAVTDPKCLVKEQMWITPGKQ